MTAAQARYEELDGAVKDAGCRIVAVPGGVSSQKGCCCEWERKREDVPVFRCGTCQYMEGAR